MENETNKQFLKIWLLMKISAENENPRVLKGRLKREWTGYAKDFGLTLFDALSPEEKENQTALWVDFFRYYTDLCMHDRTYGSTLFGLVSLKDHVVREKFANELHHTLSGFPEKIGLSELFQPLLAAADQALTL